MARRRQLTGISQSIVGSFISRNNDIGGYWGIGVLCKLAQERHQPAITLILVGDQPEAQQPLVTFYRAMLQTLMAKTAMDLQWVQQAEITIEFGTCGNRSTPPRQQWHRGDPFLCTCRITDDLGTRHFSAAGWCEPHNPQKEWQRV